MSDILTKPTSPPKARYIMIGGFLGSGKTTAVGRLAERLSATGLRVGLITNDQGRNLVDTAMLRAQGFATEEIPGGCFCCRFNSLVEASRKLTQANRPDIFIAEPVGSCTDLVATVTYPLRRLYGNEFTIAPLSVLVDPVRARRVFGLQRGGSFSEKVLYIYRKQLEEADLIVVSKADTLNSAEIDTLRRALADRYPGKVVMAVSARSGLNLDEWLALVSSGEQSSRATMPVDYDSYAEGEALLGWLNCTVAIKADLEFSPDEYLRHLAAEIQGQLKIAGAEIAHLKMTFTPDDGLGHIAAVHLVRNDFVPELSIELGERAQAGQLIVNLRAEAPPHLLGAAVQEALSAKAEPFPTLHATLDHLEHFRPSRPTPTHRDQQSTKQ